MVNEGNLVRVSVNWVYSIYKGICKFIVLTMLEFFGEKNIPGRFKPNTKNKD